MKFLTEQQQEFIYKLFIKESIEMKTECNGEYSLINGLHKMDLLKKVKMSHSNKIELRLVDRGKALALILARLNSDKNIDKDFIIGTW